MYQAECPMLEVANGTCYAQREFEKTFLIKEIQRAGQINLSSLKMSYLLIKHPRPVGPHPLSLSFA